MKLTKEQKEAIEDMNRFANGIDMSCVTARQMQIILNLIEKLQKENEELEEINNELEAVKDEAIRRYNFETIPIKKVKDKIEELNNNRQYLSQFKDYKEKDYTNEEVVNNCVEVLQELLESE